MARIKKYTHNDLCELVNGVLKSQGNNTEMYKTYNHGEMDVFCNNIYYEIKSSYNLKNILKAKSQIERAINYNQCHAGYLVTFEGVFDLFKDYKLK
jgi:hypothetical protein